MSRDACPESRAIGGLLGVSAIAESSRRCGGADEGSSVWGRSCDRGLGGEAQACAVQKSDCLQAAFLDEMSMSVGPLQASMRARRKDASSAGVVSGTESGFVLSLARYTQRNENQDGSVANSPQRGEFFSLLPSLRIGNTPALGADGACLFAPAPGPPYGLGVVRRCDAGRAAWHMPVDGTRKVATTPGSISPSIQSPFGPRSGHRVHDPQAFKQDKVYFPRTQLSGAGIASHQRRLWTSMEGRRYGENTRKPAGVRCYSGRSHYQR